MRHYRRASTLLQQKLHAKFDKAPSMIEVSGSESPFRKYEQAGAYHHALMDRDPLYVAKIQKAVSFVHPGAVVLDVGCGDGVFVKYAREAGARVIGIDPSKDGVRLAKQMASSSDLCVGTAHCLPFGTSSVDVVVMIDVVNYLSRCEEAIREAARTLKPDGVLLIMSPFAVSLEAERAAIPDSWQIHVWTVEQMTALAEKYVHVSDVMYIEKAVPAAGLDAMIAVVRALGLARVVHGAAAALRRHVKLPRGSARGNVVLNTLSLPGRFVRRQDKVEYILVARRPSRTA